MWLVRSSRSFFPTTKHAASSSPRETKNFSPFFLVRSFSPSCLSSRSAPLQRLFVSATCPLRDRGRKGFFLPFAGLRYFPESSEDKGSSLVSIDSHRPPTKVTPEFIDSESENEKTPESSKTRENGTCIRLAQSAYKHSKIREPELFVSRASFLSYTAPIRLSFPHCHVSGLPPTSPPKKSKKVTTSRYAFIYSSPLLFLCVEPRKVPRYRKQPSLTVR